MSARRSWPPPGWTWSSELETYVPLDRKGTEELTRDELRELEEYARWRASRGLEDAESSPRLTP